MGFAAVLSALLRLSNTDYVKPKWQSWIQWLIDSSDTDRLHVLLKLLSHFIKYNCLVKCRWIHSLPFPHWFWMTSISDDNFLTNPTNKPKIIFLILRFYLAKSFTNKYVASQSPKVTMQDICQINRHGRV